MCQAICRTWVGASTGMVICSRIGSIVQINSSRDRSHAYENKGGCTLVDEALVVVAGLGEVGRPLMNILSRTFTCTGIDMDPVTIECEVSVLHICYPFQIDGFN